MKEALYDLYYSSALVRSVHTFSSPRAWRLRYAKPVGGFRAAPGTPREHLDAALAWLCRAQDAVEGGGVSAGYTMRGGWQPPYPETTGYIVNTFLDHAAASGDDRFRQRAIRMADWLVSIQNPDGSFPGGVLGRRRNPPVVFNVGQILQGLVAAYSETKDGRYFAAAERAGTWLLAVQDPDGAWRRHEYNGIPHAYHSRVSWPLASLSAVTGDARYAKAARRNAEWVASLQRPSGWFAQSAFRASDVPFTHTISYTLEGLLETGRLLGDERAAAAARRGAHALLRRFEATRGAWGRAPRGLIPGRLDERWRSRDRFACLTGCAQIAWVWLRLAELDDDLRYLNAALKLLDALRTVHDVGPEAHEDVRGALPGSFPAHGAYMSYTYPNWAAKFLADALLQEEAALKRVTGAPP